MLRVYAAAKAVRAWTYMQIVLNYGEAVYYEEPILSLQDAKKSYPTYDMNALATALIADLTPYKNVEKLQLGSIYDFNMSKALFSIRFLLGDLYLWTNRYEEAANEYRDLMLQEKIVINSSYKSYLNVINNAFTGYGYIDWSLIFDNDNNREVITALPLSNEYKYNFQIDSLTKENKIVASQIAAKNWDSAHYVYSASLDTLTDMRKYGSYYTYTYSEGRNTVSYNNIYKYHGMNPTTSKSKQIFIARAGLLYLRYAEAVNRLGKPNLALAVLKNGLSKTTIANNKLVPLSEKGTVVPQYMNFDNDIFNNNIGTKARGAGNVLFDTLYYRIPNFAASPTPKDDSVAFVEDMIVDELALETAFEGNRFHDLMRVAIRRNNSDYLAQKVAAKNPSVYTKLINQNNWYLKKP